MIEEFLVKHDEKPIESSGKPPHQRTISELLERGFVNVDKDSGPTSHQTADSLKNILKIDKAGHSGTLDPKVTGVLLIGLNKATRLMEYMLKSNKEYVCLMFLHKPVDEKKIKETFLKFTGKIMQTPPIVSAVKRQERERTIYYNEILEIKDNQFVLFRVGCQHGTYIRKLCSDMGDDLNVKAQMIELRRTKAGPIREEDNIISLDKLRNLYELYNNEKEEKRNLVLENELKKYIRPMEEVLKDYKKVIARDSAVDTVCHGSDLAVPGVSKLNSNIEIGEEVAVMTHKGELIAFGTAFMSSKDVMKKNKGAFIKTDKVFMDIGTYPGYWNFKK